jgi:hypothetical protein
MSEDSHAGRPTRERLLCKRQWAFILRTTDMRGLLDAAILRNTSAVISPHSYRLGTTRRKALARMGLGPSAPVAWSRCRDVFIRDPALRQRNGTIVLPASNVV